MHRYDLRALLARSHNDVDELPLMKLLPELPAVRPDGPWIAGGALRRTLIGDPLTSDIDYFFATEEQCAAFCSALLSRYDARETASTKHQRTFSVKVGGDSVIVQAIRIAYYANIEAVLDSFDFTITQFGYDGEHLIAGNFALWDLARRRLALHRLTYGASTLRRLIKYTKQGFTACPGVLGDLLERIAGAPDLIQREVEYID